jgi:hypothetical protein
LIVSQVLSILDANGLTSFEGAQKFAFDKDLKEVRSFIDGMRQAMLTEERLRAKGKAGIDYANYLPGCSLRGDGGCLHWNCRLPKVRTMARYIALYSDTAVVPIRLGLFNRSVDRLRLCSVILGIIEIRPLLEAGLATLVPEEILLCKEHWDEAIPEHENIKRAAEQLADEKAPRFSATYYPPDGRGRKPSIQIRGPEEYIEHGSIRRVFERTPAWVAKLGATKPLDLTPRVMREHKLIRGLFLRMANDVFLQNYFGSAFDARYVTDSPGEREFFDVLYGREELTRRAATLCAHLAHAVPILSDVPVRTILKLRASEAEAFQSYRSTLTGIVRNHVGTGKSVGEAEAKEIYLDVLKPTLDALQVQATNIRKNQFKKGILKAAASSVLIGLGIYGGVLPSQLADLVKAIGGFSVAKDLAETFGAIEKNPTEVRNHNLYFLLRLKQEGAQRS